MYHMLTCKYIGQEQVKESLALYKIDPLPYIRKNIFSVSLKNNFYNRSVYIKAF